MNLEEAFRYPVISISLSLAFQDSNLRGNTKHHIRNYLIDVSKACESTALNEACWIIDTITVMRAIKIKETCKEWFKKVIKFTLPSSSLRPLSIEYVNDMYRGISAKNCSRDKRGQSETRVHPQSLSFFHNIKNKQHFLSLLLNYLRADDFIHQRPLPIMVDNENETRIPILQ